MRKIIVICFVGVMGALVGGTVGKVCDHYLVGIGGNSANSTTATTPSRRFFHRMSRANVPTISLSAVPKNETATEYQGRMMSIRLWEEFVAQAKLTHEQQTQILAILLDAQRRD